MKRLVIVVALVATFVAVGCEQPAPVPLDRGRIAAIQAPQTVTQNQPFDVDVYAEDLGSVNYDVRWQVASPPPAALQLVQLTCTGTIGSPSPDTSSCEYDSLTTTLMSISKSEYELVWTGAKGATISLQICASGEANGILDCVTKTINVAS
jgi:hypothetical protein